jgi:hypothetical protein
MPAATALGKSSYIELLALITAVVAVRTISLTGYLNIRYRRGGRREYTN